MRRIGLVGSGLIGALAASAILASTAVAVEYPITALPQLGRCVPVAPGTGEWIGKHCQALAVPANTGTYNWEQGPGAKPGFTATMEGFPKTEGIKLLGANPEQLIECQTAAIKGEYKEAKSEKETVELIGCVLSRTEQPCSSEPENPLKEGEVAFTAEEGTLGFNKTGKKPVAGWDQKPISVNITCGVLPTEAANLTLDTLEGSVIGKAEKMGSMFEEFRERYNAVGGKQKPEKQVGEGTDVLKSKFTSPSFVKTEEQTGLVASLTIENSESLEIKVKCVKENLPCT